MGSGRKSRRERRDLQRVARRLLRRAPRPRAGEDRARYRGRHERWGREVEVQAEERGLDVAALWECLEKLATEQANATVSPGGIMAAEAAGLLPPVDFTIPAVRTIFDAGHRDPRIFRAIARRYLEISRDLDHQPVVRWSVGRRSVLARRRPGRVEVELWLGGEREEPADVDDGGLPS